VGIMQKVAALSSRIDEQLEAQQLEVSFNGDWLSGGELPSMLTIINQIDSRQDLKGIRFSTDGLGRWDSLLVTEVIKVISFAAERGLTVDKSGLPMAMQSLLALYYAVPERMDARREKRQVSWIQSVSRFAANGVKQGEDMLAFIGELVLTVLSVVRGDAHFRRVDLLLYTQECGPSALPIVTLISLLVGLILAFVGALQLSLFGAQIYIANMVTLGMTREMGGLMTAIIMSGRTGAAYAAQIGTMHVNDELDALKTMNLEPMAFLVLPRVLALVVIMPLLCLYADLLGMVGGGLVTVSLFDVSLTEYLNRTAHAVHLADFFVGFFKSAVFGVLIAISGCMRGMQCGRSASAVGDAATSAVVTSIVFIVVADSLMTIMCNRIGI
jgi:phospholipid/cholesterol/gamma-HCH transport system permease protein